MLLKLLIFAQKGTKMEHMSTSTSKSDILSISIMSNFTIKATTPMIHMRNSLSAQDPIFQALL